MYGGAVSCAWPAYFAAVVVLGWIIAACTQCMDCYRVGNYLDFYFQRELLTQLRNSRMSPSADPSVPMRHTTGIRRGIALRRFFRLEWSSMILRPSIIETIHSRTLALVPQHELWQSPDGQRTLDKLVSGSRSSKTYGKATGDFFMWWDHTYLDLLRPILRESLRAAVESVRQKTGRRPRDRDDARTCVVHFRTGDFLREYGDDGWNATHVRRAVDAMVSAAATFSTSVSRFEVLGGGFDHRCISAFQLCGTGVLDEVARALAETFPNASVVALRDGSADDDFIRMVDAQMLLLGSCGTELKVASSFSVFAALASNAQVRLPGCFLRFGHCSRAGLDSFDGFSRLLGWRAYLHHGCAKCRGSTVDAATGAPDLRRRGEWGVATAGAPSVRWVAAMRRGGSRKWRRPPSRSAQVRSRHTLHLQGPGPAGAGDLNDLNVETGAVPRGDA